MAWCPKCKMEYREGVTVCADCGCELVAQEQYDDLVPLTLGDEEQLNRLKKYLEYNHLKGVTVKQEEDGVFMLYVRDGDKGPATTMGRVFMQQEYLRAMEEAEQNGSEEEVLEPVEHNPNHVPGLPSAINPPDKSREKYSGEATVYRNSNERAEENRSSAWTLLVVGAIGLVCMILGIAGVIPFKLGNPYMFYGVMGSVFLLFIVMGLVTMKHAKVFAKEAESENTLRDAMTEWYRENLKKETLDAEIGADEDIPEELLYFRRIELIKEKFNYQFLNLDQVFLEHFIDEEVYDAVYSEEEM